MRISSKKLDSGYTPTIYNYKVFLDNHPIPIKEIITADSKDNFIEVIRKSPKGHLITKPDSNDVDTDIIYGNVKITSVVTEQEIFEGLMKDFDITLKE